MTVDATVRPRAEALDCSGARCPSQIAGSPHINNYGNNEGELAMRINGDCGGIVEGLGEFAQHWQDHLPGPSEATQGMLAQTRTSCSRGRSGPVPYSCTTPYEYLLTKT